jgi:cytochrome c-type biogenesis protein CcmF
MIVLGRLSLTLALVFALASVVFLAWGVRRDRRDLIRNGYIAIYAFFLTAVVAGAVLLQAFLTKDFSFAYVAAHANESLSTFYRVAGFWAGQEGSFLFWTLLIAIAAVVVALVDFGRLERLTGGAVMVLAAVGAVFAALMVLDAGSNPFLEAAPGTQPAGLNPLLLHPAMVFHPPALFVGYVGLSVPFAFAISTLLLGRADKLWVLRSQKWAVFGWLALSLGIGLGAWWAYMELSFGGYWAWDPVENTSLVPWLTATALLHAFTLYKSRGLFRHWALALATLTFWFTILATWTTRTGLIQSVHAFGRRDLLVWILTGFLLVTGAASAALIAWRWRRFEAREEFESLLSREFLYHLTNLLLTLFAVAIAFSTVAVPLLFDRTVGQATYDLVAQPLGVVTLLLLAVCPLLAWRRTDGTELWRALWLPFATAALSVPLWLLLGFDSNWWGFLGLVVCGFAFGAVLQFVLRAARRAAGPERSLWSGLGRALTGSRTRTAAYLVHLGMVILLAGLLGSNVYKQETSVTIDARPGESVTLGDYTVSFSKLEEGMGPQGAARATAVFEVLDEQGTRLGTVTPDTDIDPVMGAAMRSSILGLPLRDVFVVTDEPFDTTNDQLVVRVMVFPLIRWVWIGSILLCAGAVVSLWPRGRTQEQEARAAARAAEADQATV